MTLSIITIVESIAAILGNLGIFALTSYTFWLYHFSKKISLDSVGIWTNLYKGKSINCTISNRTLSPKSIKSVYAVFEDNKVFKIKDFSPYIVVEPFHSLEIESDCFSSISIPNNTNFQILVETISGDILVKLKNDKRKISLKDINKFNKPESQRNLFNDCVIPVDISYVIVDHLKNNEYILVHKDGWLERPFYGIDQISTATEEINELKSYLQKMREDLKLDFTIVDLRYFANSKMNRTLKLDYLRRKNGT